MKIGDTGVEIRGVSRVVIDKTHVWDRGTKWDGEMDRDVFVKVGGGPGFIRMKTIPVAKMSAMIAREMIRSKYVGNQKHVLRKAWFSAGTLNIRWEDE